MAVLAVPFYLTFVDITGAPVPFGFVWTYAAGSVNTPKATYTDYTETVQAPNPIPLDAAGRCTIWVSGSYKYVLTDVNGNVLETTDHVTSFNVPAASANSFFQSFSGDGTTTVFSLSADLGVDPKAIMVFVDNNDGKGLNILNPNVITLISGATPKLQLATPPASLANNVFVFDPSLLLGAASSAANAAATSATQAAASAVTASAASLSGTSATSVLIATGSQTFTTQTGKNYTAGAWLTIASAANVANYMFGQITSYNSTTGALVVNVTSIGGSGTDADWIINIAGVQGIAGGAVANGTYGDIVVTGGGTIWTIAALAVTYAKLATAALAATTDIIAGTVSKLVTAASLAPIYFGTKVRPSTNTGVVNGTATIACATEDYDDANWHDPVTNNSRITVDFTGRVQLIAAVAVTYGASGLHTAILMKNSVAIGISTATPTGATVAGAIVTQDVACVPGDFFEMQISITTSGSPTLIASETYLSARRIK